MDNGWEIEAYTLEFHKIEEVFKDRDGEVFDTLLSVGSINQSQTKLKTFKYQDKDVHDVYRSHFHFFCLKKTLSFPDFIDW